MSMDLMFQPLNKYFDFSGRARRAEYWLFFLFYFVVSFVLVFADGALGYYIQSWGIGVLGSLFGLAMFIPGLAVTVRRLHDRDMRGWWILLVFIPILGYLALLIIFILPGTKGSNRFGKDPLPKGS